MLPSRVRGDTEDDDGGGGGRCFCCCPRPRNSYSSKLSCFSAFSHLSVLSAFCHLCLLAFGSFNSLLSLFSINSAASLLSINSFASISSINCAFCMGCVQRSFSVCPASFSGGFIIIYVLAGLLLAVCVALLVRHSQAIHNAVFNNHRLQLQRDASAYTQAPQQQTQDNGGAAIPPPPSPLPLYISKNQLYKVTDLI